MRDVKILVLCTGNSCRSQIAQGYLQTYLPMAKIYSAGIEAHGLNNTAVEVMSKNNIDISKHTSNNVEEYENIEFDYVITVCDNAKEHCPIFPAKVKMIHKSFPDPAKAKGTEEEIYMKFINVRNMIKNFCIDLSKQIQE